MYMEVNRLHYNPDGSHNRMYYNADGSLKVSAEELAAAQKLYDETNGDTNYDKGGWA